MRLFESINTAFGLDISDRSIKLVQLRRKLVLGHQVKIALANYGTLVLPQGIIVDGKIVDQKKLVQILRTFLRRGLRHRLNTSVVVANLPDNETFVTSFELPATETKNEEIILHTIEKNIPIPLQDIYYSVARLGIAPGTGQQEFLVGAVRRTISDSYASMLEDCGLAPLALEPESVALARALTRFDTASTDQFIIIDMGATRSGLVISCGRKVRLTLTLPISGNALTSAIAKKLGVKEDEAERIKIKCGFDVKRCDIELRVILERQIYNFVTKIREAFRFYENHTGEKIPKTSVILLTGGGAQLAKIETVLAEKLKMKVRLGNSCLNLVPEAQNLLDSPPSYATAIGLALPSVISSLYNNEPNQ